MACRASDRVFLIAKANDIAPRNPKITFFKESCRLVPQNTHQQKTACAGNSLEF